MKILITGATGLIGLALSKKLIEAGHELVVVTRDSENAKKHFTFPVHFIEYDLARQNIKAEHFNKVDVVINLIGETIDGRWTKNKKIEIFNSRVHSAQNLLKECPPSVNAIISTSAQGIYGDRKDEVLTEDSVLGQNDFLSDVCKQWEQPFLDFKHRATSTRITILRLGVVLNQNGGALKKLITLFKKNMGATLGSGKQWMSFISLEDVVQLYFNAVTDTQYSGIINAVCEQPVQNFALTEKLCKKLQVKQLPKVPRFILKIILGEMSQLVLFSNRSYPQKVKSFGYNFKIKNIDELLSTEIK